MSPRRRIFKALADPTRRFLLVRLFERDGRTLTELQAELAMTRFGVTKHPRVLEEAGIVVTRRKGREKPHFLNPVPIRIIHDRWVSKYAELWAEALGELKRGLEDESMEKVFEIYTKTTPERLWRAITDPEMRRRYSPLPRIGQRVPVTAAPPAPRPARPSRAKTLRSIRPAGWSSASARCGAMTRERKGPRA